MNDALHEFAPENFSRQNLPYQRILTPNMHSSDEDHSPHYKNIDVRDRNRLRQPRKGASPEFDSETIPGYKQSVFEESNLIFNTCKSEKEKVSLLKKGTSRLNVATEHSDVECESFKMDYEAFEQDKKTFCNDVKCHVWEVEEEGEECLVEDDGKGWEGKDEGQGCEVEDDDKGWEGTDEGQGYEVEDDGKGWEGKHEGQGCEVEDDDKGWEGTDEGQGYEVEDEGKGWEGKDEGQGCEVEDDGKGWEGTDEGQGYEVVDGGKGWEGKDEGQGCEVEGDGKGWEGTDEGQGYQVEDDGKGWEGKDESQGCKVEVDGIGWEGKDEGQGCDVEGLRKVKHEGKGLEVEDTSKRWKVQDESKGLEVEDDGREWMVQGESKGLKVEDVGKEWKLKDESKGLEVDDDGREWMVQDESKGLKVEDVGKEWKVKDEGKGLEVEDDGREWLVQDESKGLEVEAKDNEGNKKTVRMDAAPNEYKEGEVDIEPNFLLDWFRTLFTIGKSCKAINCGNVIRLFLFLASCSFFIEATIVEVPKNAAIVEWESPEAVAMVCKSDLEWRLKWSVKKNHDFKEEHLYNGFGDLHPDAKSYSTVIEDEPEKSHLNLTNKQEAAQTYICLEPETLAEASAELIWIGERLGNDSSSEDLVNLVCSIKYRGNWAPMMEWKEQSSQGERVLSDGFNTTTVPNQLVTSTLAMPRQNGSRNYTCTAKFDISGKPNTTTAANIPDDIQISTFKSQDAVENRTATTPASTDCVTIAAYVTIACAAILVMIIIIVCIYMYFRKKKKQRNESEKQRNKCCGHQTYVKCNSREECGKLESSV